MPRASSAAIQLAKAIQWVFRGTTEDVGAKGYLRAIEGAVANIPELTGKVTKGEIIGDPHVTMDSNGNVVAENHVSGILGKGNLKKSNKATSFHFYPETGLLKFSKKALGSFYVNNITNPETASATHQAAYIPPHQKASGWVWDNDYNGYKYWDGTQWVWQLDEE